MATEAPPRALSESDSQARALSHSESQARALSQWLELMLAEIAAKRAALEHARAEEARRRSERTTAAPQDSAGGTSPG